MINATRLPILVLLAGALAFAGCGSDDSGDGGSTGAAEQSAPAASGGGGAETVNLSETEFKIDPADPSVKNAGKVTFKVTNDGTIDHALEVEGPNGEAESDTIAAGESTTLTVDLGKAGKYEMYCPIGNHRAEGMEGSVTVAGGGSAPAEDNGGGSDDSGGSGGY